MLHWTAALVAQRPMLGLMEIIGTLGSQNEMNRIRALYFRVRAS